MKASCKALKLSILLGVIFTILTIIFSILSLNYQYEIIDILLNISIGLLGSTIVVLLLNIPAYNVSKRQRLEKFWNESKRLISAFSKVDYLLNEYNEENVINYINALNNKKRIEVYNEINPKNKIDCKDMQLKKVLADEYILNNRDLESKISKSGLEKYADEQIDKYIEKLRNKSEKICQQYIILSNESTAELNFLLGDMEFFLGKKPYEKIYKKLYQPLFEKLDKIKEEVYHFELYLENQGKEAVVLEKLFTLQKELFALKTKENDKMKTYIVTGKFNDSILMSLEEFRADMYNIKPEYQKTHPILCKTIKKEDN